MEAAKTTLKSSGFDSKILKKGRDLLLENLRESIIGDFYSFKTPFGSKPLVYADYVASARGVDFIEKFLLELVLPFYANTHTFTSYVGSQTGALREEARQIIKYSLNGTSEDVVLFVGAGATGAANKLVNILKNSFWGNRHGFYGQSKNGKFPCLACGKLFETDGPFLKHLNENHIQINEYNENENLKPVVFVAVYEHHSNILPWREAGADVVFIKDNDEGMLDLDHLRAELKKHSDRKFKIGSFSACSNVTGVLTNVVEVTDLLKENGALAFFDYAAGAPYLAIDVNPHGHYSIDGIFFSGHKLIGGPGTPGILCVKRRLLGNSVPTQSGGGTVFFVTDKEHTYLENPEEKEEGGTPDIMGSIRLGLAFHLKSTIGDNFIMETELSHYKKVVKRLNEIPNLLLLGKTKANRLPIFSFLIKHENKFLHYGFVSALLNDLFGIETRGGCACAGPYALRLLNISNEKADRYRDARLQGYELFVPGFSRFSINYFFSPQTIEYIYEAIKFICENGIWFLPLYRFVLSQKTASFKNSENMMGKTLSLRNLKLNSDKAPLVNPKKINPNDLKKYLKLAYKMLEKIKKRNISKDWIHKEFEFTPEIEELRWFVLPSEATEWVLNRTKDLSLPHGERRLEFEIDEEDDSQLKLPKILKGNNLTPASFTNKRHLNFIGESYRKTSNHLFSRKKL